ncbi:hypothetical protein ACNUDN_02590 [Mycobacterium sp. smrl_JER01]
MHMPELAPVADSLGVIPWILGLLVVLCPRVGLQSTPRSRTLP